MRQDTMLELTADENEAALYQLPTLDWLGSPIWYDVFRRWAECTGSSDGLWYADLYHTQLQIDYLKDDAPADLWQQYLLYLPTGGGVPDAAMADIERLARGEAIDRSVDDVLNEMSSFMINDVYQPITHNYFYGPFSKAITEHKQAWGVDGNGHGPSAQAAQADPDDGHYGLSALPEDDDGHYGLSALPDDEHTYDTYPGTPEPAAPIEDLVPFAEAQAENQRALKEAQEPGTRIPFWQFGGYILLGQGHDPAHYQHLLDRGAVAGWVTVVSRGNTLRRTPGLVQVVGSNDPESFAASIGQFSNKRLEFV